MIPLILLFFDFPYVPAYRRTASTAKTEIPPIHR